MPLPFENLRRSRLFRIALRSRSLLPLTVRGVLVAVIGLWCFRSLGLARLDLLALIFGVGLLSLVAFSITAAVVAIPYLRRRGQEPSSHLELEAGTPAKTGFELPYLRFAPLLRVDWVWTEPRVDRCSSLSGTEKLEEEIVPSHRADTNTITRRFAVGDVFGLVRIEWNEQAERRVVVLPNIGGFRRAPVVRAFAEGQDLPVQHGSLDGDRMDIRRYVPGDSIRHILWRSFALNRQLDVRIPEPSAEPSRRMVAYLVCGELDEAAAGMARLALETGALGEGWVFGVDGDSNPYRRAKPALRAIAKSANVDHRQGSGLGSFLASAIAGSGAAQTYCVVFAPPVPGPWLQDLSATVARFPQRISILLACDELNSGNHQPLFQRIVYEQIESRRPNHSDIREVEATLAALPAFTSEISLFDRVSGNEISYMPSTSTSSHKAAHSSSNRAGLGLR